jgi:Transposase DDE domain
VRSRDGAAEAVQEVAEESVELSFGWMARFRRLARDHERLSETLEGLHYVAFSFLMIHRPAPQFCWSY